MTKLRTIFVIGEIRGFWRMRSEASHDVGPREGGWRRGLGLVLLLLICVGCGVWAGDAAEAASTNACIVCDASLLTGRVWRHPAGLVCDPCSKLERRCSLCGLPVKVGFVRTGDGRVICRHDAGKVLLTQTQAQEVLEETRRHLIRLSHGVLALQHAGVAVSVFDVDYWNYRDGKPVAEDMRRLGFASTRRDGDGMHHSMVLLSGQYLDQARATAAHEYQHLWLNEQMPPGREIERDTMEAICELAALKVVRDRGDKDTESRLLKNPYTRGKIKIVAGWEERFGWWTILEWVRRGRTHELDASELTVSMPSAVETPVARAERGPWVLQGVFGTAQARRALVNGKSLTAGQSLEMESDGKMVRVKCLSVERRGVLLQVEGKSEPVRLELEGIGDR